VKQNGCRMIEEIQRHYMKRWAGVREVLDVEAEVFW
jgi:hypothetical protein